MTKIGDTLPKPCGRLTVRGHHAKEKRLCAAAVLAQILVAWCFAVSANAEPLKVLREPLPDYSYAGYRFGADATPSTPKQIIQVESFGAKANDGLDDSKAFQKALAAAHASAVPISLQMGAGRFDLSEILFIERSDITFEGAGAGQFGTVLYFPRPLAMVETGKNFSEITDYLVQENKYQIELENNVNRLFSPYSWTGGFIWVRKPDSRPFPYLQSYDPTKPEPRTAVRSGIAAKRMIKLNAVTKHGYIAGQMVQIEWYSPLGKDSALIGAIYGQRLQDLVSPVGSRLWEDPKRALVTQITRITAVSGDQIEIANPLMHDINSALPANLSAWSGVENVVLRDFSIRFPKGPSFPHHLEQGYNGIVLSDAVDAWIEAITIHEADSGILTYNSASSTIRDIHTTGQRRAHYAVHLGNVHALLVSDLEIRNPVIHSLSLNTYCTRSVFQRARIWQAPVIDQHAGVNQQNLIEQIEFYIHAQRDAQGRASYPLWNGSGASYWQPGHGRYNTHWNYRVTVLDGARSDETVQLLGLDEGPDAYIIGIHGNRQFVIDYRPRPYIEALNQLPQNVPSIYDWQRARRLRLEQ